MAANLSRVLPAPHTVLVLIALAAFALVLRAVAWRLWQLFRPQDVILRPATEAEARPPEGFPALTSALAGLGFAPLGARVEKPRFAKATVSFELGNAGARAFATVQRAGRGQARLYFLSPTDDGRLLLTPTAPEHLSEGWAAHTRRVEGRAREGRYDLGEREALARAWYAGEGKSQIRRQHVPVLLWSLLALGMVNWALFFRS